MTYYFFCTLCWEVVCCGIIVGILTFLVWMFLSRKAGYPNWPKRALGVLSSILSRCVRISKHNNYAAVAYHHNSSISTKGEKIVIQSIGYKQNKATGNKAQMRTTRSRHRSPNPRMPPSLKYRSGVSKAKNRRFSNSTTMATSTVKSRGMRQWLENLLDQKKVEGLSWVDRDEKTFEITWCHASRHEFNSDKHAELFKLYAEFTGRSSVIGPKGYNSKLKSNFRSALNSLNDCIQIEDTRKAKGEKAVKLFQFIDSEHPEYKKKRDKKLKNQRRRPSTSQSKVTEPATVTPKLEVDASPMPYDSWEEGEITLPSDAAEVLGMSSPFHSGGIVTSPFVPVLPSHSQSSPVFLLSPSTSSNLWNEDILKPATALPNFTALGVKDEFEIPVQHNHSSLTCGGSVKVKKEMEVKPVINFQFPHSSLQLPPPTIKLPPPPNPTELYILVEKEQQIDSQTDNENLTMTILQPAQLQQASSGVDVNAIGFSSLSNTEFGSDTVIIEHLDSGSVIQDGNYNIIENPSAMNLDF